MRKIFLITAIVLFAACDKDPVSVQQSNNKNIELQLLFEQDGCKMYRFVDGGQNIYWSQCAGSTTQNVYHSNGKDGGYYSRIKEITTNQR